jgi:molybdopterin molybdotransferase
VPVTGAVGRVLAAAATSTVDVPPFRRATMDGYAVVAADTFGASLYNPVPLHLSGESMPGRGDQEPLVAGAARRIMTGAPVPPGADAVVRAEDADEAGDKVEIRAAVSAGKNVGRIGEDIAADSTVLAAGRRLRPEDAGLLSSIGLAPVPVHRRPQVRIIVSGNELLPPGSRPDGSHIVDSNSVMLAGLVERDGGEVETIERLPDDRELIGAALARPGADAIVTAGGVSVGKEDFLPMLIDELGTLAVHGVAMRPSSPTGIGRLGSVPVLLLPGNPVSCLVAYDFFAGPVVRTMAGLPAAMPYRLDSLPLGGRLVSQIGRTDYARVRIDDGSVRPLAIAGASVLSSVTRADGFVIVPAGSEGFAEGTNVDVYRYGTTTW